MTRKRKPEPPTAEQIKDAADRAEGLKPEPARPGRPATYQPGFATQAEKLCRHGFTDQELADFFNVDVRTIYRWKNDYPEFCQSLKAGKEHLDERVERSLYHRAIGYTFESEKVFQFQGAIVRTPTREHIPPDTTAAIFWLKNRRSQEWRDVHKHEHGRAGEFSNMGDAELERAIQERAKALGLPLPMLAVTTKLDS